jgi:S-disulfanyl-L-cysteine oxidoreductase SoxD
MHDAQRTPRPSACRSAICRPHRPAAWLLLAAAVFIASAGSTLLRAQAPRPQGRTVWDGVYTDAQATRGSSTFSTICINCHTLAATGNRPLTGDKFWDGFTQKSVGDLLTFVKTNMPNGNGGSLSASTYNDVVALILKSNGFPAGVTELAPETVTDVQIIPKDGPGELPAGTLVRVVGCLTRNGRDWVLTSATVPERIAKSGVVPEDATRALGDRTVPLKFVLTRLDALVGHRMSASGLLIGKGGVDGINVATVTGVADVCP